VPYIIDEHLEEIEIIWEDHNANTHINKHGHKSKKQTARRKSQIQNNRQRAFGLFGLQLEQRGNGGEEGNRKEK